MQFSMRLAVRRSWPDFLAENQVFTALAFVVLVWPSGYCQPIRPNLAPTDRPAVEANQLVGQRKAIFGKVAQVTFRETVVFLNLEKPYPDNPCSGVIYADRTNLFRDLEKLEGHTIVITGKVTLYNGRPQVVLDSTNQLEIIAEPTAPAGLEAAPHQETKAQDSSVLRPTDGPARAQDDHWAAAGWWIAGALVAIAALLGWLVLSFRRSGLGAPRPVLPSNALALRQGTEIAPAPADALRSLAPGSLMEPDAQALREKIASDLTEFAKQKLVQELYSQQKELAETQKKAQQALVEMEARLAALHLPVQERIRAYENRISELDRELATRHGEMRDLIQATLLLVRARLQEAKEQTASRSDEIL